MTTIARHSEITRATELLQKAFQELAEHGERQAENYSGRGMFGKECLGISGSKNELRQVISGMIGASLVYDLVDMVADRSSPDSEEYIEKECCAVNCAISMLLDWEEDSLGRGVIYYWPGLDLALDDEGQVVNLDDRGAL